MHPQTKNGKHSNRANQHTKLEDRQVGDVADRFTADTAEKTGTSECAIQRDASRGTKIDAIKKVVGTSLDKGEELDALLLLQRHFQQSADSLWAAWKVCLLGAPGIDSSKAGGLEPH